MKRTRTSDSPASRTEWPGAKGCEQQINGGEAIGSSDISEPGRYSEASTTQAERRLVRAVRRGDQRAFTRLVHAYQDRVFGVCLRMLKRHDEAEDLAQEVFVSLHRSLGSFREESKLSTYVYKVTRNHCLNRLRYLERRREDAKTTYDEAMDGHGNVSGGHASTRPDEHAEGVELQRVLERALAELPDEQRLLVILRDVQGLSYDELVEISELPVGTVKSRLHRARLNLTERMKEWREGTLVSSRAGKFPKIAHGDPE